MCLFSWVRREAPKNVNHNTRSLTNGSDQSSCGPLKMTMSKKAPETDLYEG